MADPLSHLLSIVPTGAADSSFHSRSAEKLPYTTEGARDRLGGLKALLSSFYLAVLTQDWPAIQLWCNSLRCGLHYLKLDMPREVRATLAAILCNLAFAPGTPPGMGDLISTFRDLTWDDDGERHLVDARLMTLHNKLDWRQMIKQLEWPYLGFRNDMVQGSFNAFRLLVWAQALLDPLDQMAILERLLPFVDAAHPDTWEAAQVAKLISTMVPTAPAPASRPDCELATILPMIFHLLAMQHRNYFATLNYVQLLFNLSVSHLECDHDRFGPHGIFDLAQSDAVFGAISRLLLLDDKQGGQSFFNPPVTGRVPYERRDSRETVATKIGEWIAYSLSPMCEMQHHSILAGLKRLVDSLCVLYHPAAKPPDILFVARLFWSVAYYFSLRYHKEQTGELKTPLDRQLSPALKRKFVLLLRRPLLLGAFSQHMPSENHSGETHIYPISSWSHGSLRILADLEPDLIVPAALRSFYVGLTMGEFDGDATCLTISLLHQLSSAIVWGKRFQCHAPFVIERACEVGIFPNNTELTIAVAKLFKTTISSFPWVPLTKKSKGEGDSSVDEQGWLQWVMGEMERLCQASPGEEDQMAHDGQEELSDDRKATLLRSAAVRMSDFPGKFLKQVLDFLKEAYSGSGHPTANGDSSQDQGRAELDAAASELTAAACEGLRLLSGDRLREATQMMAQRFLSTPLPGATGHAAKLLEAALLQDPDACLAVFVPELIDRLKQEVKQHQGRDASLRRYQSLLTPGYNLEWYTRLLNRCLRLGGESNLHHSKQPVLGLVKTIEVSSILRASTLSDRLISQLLAGLTTTYAARYEVVSADDCFDGRPSTGYWGWDLVETNIIWHVPSSEALSAAYEIFAARLSHHEKSIRRLAGEYRDSLWKNASERKDGLQRLADALDGAAELLCGVASLLDPRHAFSSMDGSIHDDEAARVAWHARDMQPNLKNTKAHERRSSVAQLAAEVSELLISRGEESSVCFEALINLFRTLVGDVGICREHKASGTTREDRESWKHHFTFPPGISPRYPPGFRVLDANNYHVDAQMMATTYRGMGDVEAAAVPVLIEGCCSPYEDVAEGAQVVLDICLTIVAGFARHFLPLMLQKARELVAGYDSSSDESARLMVPRILNALRSLLGGQVHGLNKGLFWARDCPSNVPELTRLMNDAVGTQHDSILNLAFDGLQQLKLRANWDSRAFPDTRCADAIRSGHADLEAIRKACEVRDQQKAGVDMQMQEVGLQMLKTVGSQQRYIIEFAGTIFAGGFAQTSSSHTAEYASALRDGVVSGDIKIRHTCMRGFFNLINVCLARAVFGDQGLEAYVRAWGRTAAAHGLIEVDPQGDWNMIHRILRRFGELEGADEFVDDLQVGSLVWSKFKALKVDDDASKTAVENSDTLGTLGACFSQDWFAAFVNILQGEEVPEEGMGIDGGAGPVVNRLQVDFLSCVFTLMGHGKTAAVLDNIKALVLQNFASGTNSSIGIHTATAALLAGLVLAPTPPDFHRQALNFVTLTVVDILEQLVPECRNIWNQFLELLFVRHDPRRYPGLVRHILSLRMDSDIHNECKLMAVHVAVDTWGWRLFYVHTQPVLDHLLATHTKGEIQRVDASRKVGSILADAALRESRVSASDVATLVASNVAASPLGIAPYPPSAGLENTASRIFAVARLRRGTPAGALHKDSYVYACTVALAWLHKILRSSASTVLGPLLGYFLDDLFHMLDIRHAEEKNIRVLARDVLVSLSSLQFSADNARTYLQAVLERAWTAHNGSILPTVFSSRSGGDSGDKLHNEDMADTYQRFVKTQLNVEIPELLIGIIGRIQQQRRSGARPASTLRTRRTAMGMLRMYYLRRLLVSDTAEEQLTIQLGAWTQTYDAHVDMRTNGYATLKDMLSRSHRPAAEGFARALVAPAKKLLEASAAKPVAASSADAIKAQAADRMLRRHAAVLGLGVVVTAFPHVTHPEKWMLDAAEALSHVAVLSDTSVVTKDAQNFVRTFKQDRSTTWYALKKILSKEMLDNLTYMAGHASYIA